MQPKSAFQVEGAVGTRVHVAMPAGSWKGPRGRAEEDEAAKLQARDLESPQTKPGQSDLLSTDLKSTHAGEAPGISSVPGGSGEMRNRERERLLRSSAESVKEAGTKVPAFPASFPLPLHSPGQQIAALQPALTRNMHTHAGAHSVP